MKRILDPEGDDDPMGGIDFGRYKRFSLRPYRNRAPRSKWVPSKGRVPIFRGPEGHAFAKGAIAPFAGRRELKYLDIASATYAADTTGTVTALNLLAVGDDNTSRDGRQVTIKSVQVRGYLEPQDATTVPTKCRILLVWDNAVNSGTIATVTDILTASTSVSFPKIDNSRRFTILVDHSFTAGGVSNVASQTYAQGQITEDIEIYKKLNLITQYSGTTAAIGSIQNGALLMVTIGSNAAASASEALLATRIRFTDD